MAYSSRKVDLSRFKEGPALGRGRFGVVYLYEQITIAEYDKIAVKKLQFFNDEEKCKIQNEINILSKLNHPNIVQYLGDYEVENQLLITMEYMQGGSIENRLESGAFSEQTTRKYTTDILKGLQYLHLHEIIHRDIKGGNILLSSRDTAKLADFGISKELPGGTANSGGHTLIGTDLFMAPEVAKSGDQEGKPYGRKSDIWSVGCVVVQMLTSHPPWYGLCHYQFIFAIGSGNHPEYQLPAEVSEEAKKILNKCFSVNPDDRPTADQLLSDNFFPPSFRERSSLGDVTYGGENFNVFWGPSRESQTVKSEEEDFSLRADPTQLVLDMERIAVCLHIAVLGGKVHHEIWDNVKSMTLNVEKLIEMFSCANLQLMNSIDDITDAEESWIQLSVEGYHDFARQNASYVHVASLEMINIVEKLRAESDMTMDTCQQCLVKTIQAKRHFSDMFEMQREIIHQDERQVYGFLESGISVLTICNLKCHAFFEKVRMTAECIDKEGPDTTVIADKTLLSSKAWKMNVVRFYSRLVALRKVLENIQPTFEKVQRDITDVLSENPSMEEAKKRIPGLFNEVLRKGEEILRKKQEKTEKRFKMFDHKY